MARLKAYFQKDLIEAGCDEAGRGCLAGPVVAAAVILPKTFRHKVLNDSKQLTKKQRDKLELIIKKKAVAWSVAEVSNQEIDNINILNASFEAMHRALDQLAVKSEFILVDGNRFKPYKDVPFECIVKGDGKFYSIAAASVLAKNHRDRLMECHAQDYPGYKWETNVGYPTYEHREGIKKLGVTPLHRMTFQLLPSQLELFQDY
ncbi:MAG: ribonuclease HII [Cyclobacteriaceae bacterium]